MEENLIINNDLNSALCEVEAVLKERLNVKIVGKLLDSEGPSLKVLFSRPEGYTDGKLIKEISDIGVELAVALPSFLMKFQIQASTIEMNIERNDSRESDKEVDFSQYVGPASDNLIGEMIIDGFKKALRDVYAEYRPFNIPNNVAVDLMVNSLITFNDCHNKVKNLENSNEQE
jgi:hypothetical protein